MAKLQDLNVTQTEFSFLVGTSTRTVRNKIVEGLPSLGRRGLHFITAFHWWMANVIGTEGEETLTDLRKEKFRIENELKNIELLIKRGELLPRAEIAAHNSAVIQATKQRLLLLRRILPPKLSGLEPREQGVVIKKEIFQILENFYRGIKKGVRKA